MLKTIHKVLSVCLLTWKLGIACYKFHRNFSFKRSYISRLARLDQTPHDEKQSLLTIVFICLIQHLTS